MCLSRIEIPDNVSISEVFSIGEVLSYSTAGLAKWAGKSPEAKRKVGSDWFKQRRSAVLAVPSFVAHIGDFSERNYLRTRCIRTLKHILFSTPEKFSFDQRLKIPLPRLKGH
jgi:RES domain-containing protein